MCAGVKTVLLDKLLTVRITIEMMSLIHNNQLVRLLPVLFLHRHEFDLIASCFFAGLNDAPRWIAFKVSEKDMQAAQDLGIQLLGTEEFEASTEPTTKSQFE